VPLKSPDVSLTGDYVEALPIVVTFWRADTIKPVEDVKVTTGIKGKR
jgi:hypothetical protein